MNARLRFVAAVMGFLLSVGLARGGESVTVQGKIEKIDTTNRRIVILPRGSDEKIELELTRKTTIKRDGKEDVGLDTIKPGDNAKIKYDSELLVVALIDLGDEVESKPIEVLNLEELNGPGDEYSCTLTLDGLEIFWSVSADKFVTTHIYSARRKNLDAFFIDKKQLFPGHSPTLSADGLQMIFRSSAGNETVSLATRKDRTDEFGRPRGIPSLSFPGVVAAPRWLTADGLTLYLDTKEDGRLLNRKVTRATTKDEWSKPVLVAANFVGQPKDFRFYQVSSSPDDLQLYCTAEFTPPGGQRIGRFGVLSRLEPNGPYREWREIPLTAPDGQPAGGQRALFLRQTNELFFASTHFFSDPKMADKHRLDLWVIKDFVPPK